MAPFSAPVGLDPVAALARDQRGRDHDAILAELGEPPLDHETARPGFIDEVEHDILAAQFDHQFLQRVQVIADLAVRAHLAAAVGDGDGVMFFVDIQTDVLMMLLHELLGCDRFVRSTVLALPHFGGANREHTGGKLLPLEQKTTAALFFMQPLCLGVKPNEDWTENLDWDNARVCGGC